MRQIIKKKYYNLFDNNVTNFANSDILEKQIQQDFGQQIANVRHDNPFRSKDNINKKPSPGGT